MNSPLSRLSSSLNVVMPFRFNASYRWLVNFLWVSKPLKMIKTLYSYLHAGIIEEEEEEEEGKHEEEAFSVPIELLSGNTLKMCIKKSIQLVLKN